MNQNPGLLTSRTDAGPRAEPSLKLLLELEPVHRAFWRNLSDLVTARWTPPVGITSRPGTFWSDVFVASRIPWWRFLESMLCHLIAVAIIMNLSQEWTLREKLERRKAFQHISISYYRPAPTFPALGSNPGRARGQLKGQADPVQPSTIRVAPEHAQRIMAPPDIKMSGPARPDIVAPKPALPAMPLSATGRWQRSGPSSAAMVVAPPPELRQGIGRRPGLLQVSAVGPPSNVGGLFSLRTSATPSATVVGPAPFLPGTIHRISDLNIGRSDAVAPAPRLPMEEQRAVSGKAQGILGSAAASEVVPPPPSVPGSGTFAGGRGRAPSGGALQVVPPAPTVQGPGSPTGGRVNWTSGAGMQVVPPAPSVEGAGSTPRGGPGIALSSSLSVVPPAPSVQGAGASGVGRGGALGAGMQVVPPVPSVEGAGSAAGGGRGSSLSSGLQAVPPAPSIEGAGGSRGGGMGSLASAGMEAGAPAASVQNAVSSAAGGRAMAMDATQPPPSANDDSNEPATEELPIRIIGQALALPNSSYFSNYEVFIAERRRGNGKTQLIKLVYVSLPYQRRLSEYGVNSTKIYKLRVTRDSSCDETLLEMTWPQADPSHPNAANPIGPPTLGPNDPNTTLPCYRTTADDYRKAISK